MLADRAHSANSELAVLAEVLSVLPARSGSVSNSGRLELDGVRQACHAGTHPVVSTKVQGAGSCGALGPLRMQPPTLDL